MHNVPYDRHPGYQKTIAVVKSQYYWTCMKKEVVDFISKCLECQNLKAKKRHPTIFLNPFPVLEYHSLLDPSLPQFIEWTFMNSQ